MAKVHHLVKLFGGMKYAFDMEWKIRLFTMEVLDYSLIQQFDTLALRQKTSFNFVPRDLKIDGEKSIEQFGQRVMPDITVVDSHSNDLVLIIEIKNLKCNKGKAIMK